MKALLPNDHRIMSWDPENMEQYWQQCKTYDLVPNIDINQSERLSRNAFKKMKPAFSRLFVE